VQSVDFYDTFYLWDTLEPIFDLYNTLRNYSKAVIMNIQGTSTVVGYEIDTTVLTLLVQGMDVKKTLFYVPFLHAEYTSIILEDSRNG
jgi:hypothetical protein